MNKDSKELITEAHKTLANICGTMYVLTYFCKRYKEEEIISYILPVLNYIEKDADKLYLDIFNYLHGKEREEILHN